MDGTYIKVRGQWKYLYRAVDKAGKTVDFLLRPLLDKAAARRYFEKTMNQNGAPETVTMDKSGANLAAIREHQRSTGSAHRGPSDQVSQQHCRTGPARHQAHHQPHDVLQGFPVRPHHSVRHRSDEHDQKMANEGRHHHANSGFSIRFFTDLRNPYHGRNFFLVSLIATQPACPVDEQIERMTPARRAYFSAQPDTDRCPDAPFTPQPIKKFDRSAHATSLRFVETLPQLAAATKLR